MAHFLTHFIYGAKKYTYNTPSQLKGFKIYQILNIGKDEIAVNIRDQSLETLSTEQRNALAFVLLLDKNGDSEEDRRKQINKYLKTHEQKIKDADALVVKALQERIELFNPGSDVRVEKGLTAKYVEDAEADDNDFDDFIAQQQAEEDARNQKQAEEDARKRKKAVEDDAQEKDARKQQKDDAALAAEFGEFGGRRKSRRRKRSTKSKKNKTKYSKHFKSKKNKSIKRLKKSKTRVTRNK
jgi:hypothetical protein